MGDFTFWPKGMSDKRQNRPILSADKNLLCAMQKSPDFVSWQNRQILSAKIEHVLSSMILSADFSRQNYRPCVMVHRFCRATQPCPQKSADFVVHLTSPLQSVNQSVRTDLCSVCVSNESDLLCVLVVCVWQIKQCEICELCSSACGL